MEREITRPASLDVYKKNVNEMEQSKFSQVKCFEVAFL